MKIKKFVASLLSILLVVLISALNVSAVPAPDYIGNVDRDGETTVKDATLIQKHIAGIASFTKLQMVLADVDKDGNITVKDATKIQKRCAGVSIYPIEAFWSRTDIYGFNADFDSGKAMVGVPVTFIVNAIANHEPITYKYFINGEVVCELTTDNTFTCTFDEAGIYKVEAIAYNDLETESWRATLDYEVIEAYTSDTVKMKAFYYDHNKRIIYKGDHNIVFTAEAMFGSGEYEYAFYISGELVQDFSPKNTYTVEVFDRAKAYSMYVKVRDAVTGDKDGEVMLIEVNDGSIIG